MRDIVNTPCAMKMVHVGAAKGPESDNGSQSSGTHDRLDLLLSGDSAEKSPPWLEDLFPGINETLQLIAGSEGHPGELVQSKRRIGDQHMTLTRSDGRVVFEMRPAAVANAKPTLNVDDKGGWRLPLTFVGLLTRRDEITLKQIGDYTAGADLVLNCGGLQLELPTGESDEDDEPLKPSTKTRKAKTSGTTHAEATA